MREMLRDSYRRFIVSSEPQLFVCFSGSCAPFGTANGSAAPILYADVEMKTLSSLLNLKHWAIDCTAVAA
jgi:hypothetical protein